MAEFGEKVSRVVHVNNMQVVDTDSVTQIVAHENDHELAAGGTRRTGDVQAASVIQQGTRT